MSSPRPVPGPPPGRSTALTHRIRVRTEPVEEAPRPAPVLGSDPQLLTGFWNARCETDECFETVPRHLRTCRAHGEKRRA